MNKIKYDIVMFLVNDLYAFCVGEMWAVLAGGALPALPILCRVSRGGVQHAAVHITGIQSDRRQGRPVTDGSPIPVHDWPEGEGVPKTGERVIDFIAQVHKTKEPFGQEGPITVHCR